MNDELREAGDGYEVRTWVKHEPSGVVVLPGHPQLGGRYCQTDGGDWPCATVRAALAAHRVEPAPTLDERARVERDARLRDARDALDMAALWLHRTFDLPARDSQQAESWERKARSGRVALAATPAPTLDVVDALLAELAESPLPGARYAFDVVKRRLGGTYDPSL